MNRLARGALIGALSLAAALPAAARPVTIDDLMGQESFGRILADPTGRYAVIERRRPYESAATFAYDYYTQHLLSELILAPLDSAGGSPLPLSPDGSGAGHVAGAWSPAGTRLLVFRLEARRWSAGVYTVATRELRWLDLTPDQPLAGRTFQWSSEDELVMLALPRGRLPWHLRLPWEATARLPELWALAHEGRTPSAAVYGSGALARAEPAGDLRALVHVDVTSGRARILAEGHFEDMELSPNGRHVAVTVLADPIAYDPDAPFLQGDPSHRRRLDLIDTSTGAVWTPAPEAEVISTLLSWSPQGERLMTWMRPKDRSWTEGDLVLINPRDESLTPVPLHGHQPAWTETSLRAPSLRTVWLGGAPLVHMRRQEGGADWVRLTPGEAEPLTAGLERPGALAAISSEAAIVQADGAAWRVRPGAAPQRLTSEDVDVRPAPVHLVLNTPRLALNDPPQRDWAPFVDDGGRLYRAGLDRPVGRLTGDLAAVAGDAVVTVHTNSQGVGEVLHEDRSLAEVNTSFSEVAFARRVAVDHVGPGGAPLRSWLYLPPQGGTPPLVVLVYPGAVYTRPHPWLEPGGANFLTSAQVLAGLGYAVLTPSLPRHHAEEPVSGLGAQIETVIEAAADVGGFDPQRLVLWGHSYGTYGSLAAAAQSERFSAVIAMNGPSDLAREWGEFVPTRRAFPEDGLSIRSKAGWVETGQGSMTMPPWADPDAYVRNSPFYLADRITAPVMLVAADMDYSTLSGAEAMFSALYRLGRDAQLVVYHGEGHILASPANHRDLYERIHAWLIRTVGPPQGPAPTFGPSSRSER